MAESTDTGLIKNVNDDEYDGRNLVAEDNQDGVENYIGVDPIYQNYANETEKPLPFSDEELDEAARRGGVDPAEGSDKDDEDDGKDDERSTSQKTAAKKPVSPPPPKASVPAQRETTK